MQFSLPENLKNSIVAYDLVLKKEWAAQRVRKVQTGEAKPRFSLGIPIDLVPETIIPKKDLITILENINLREAAERYHSSHNFVIYNYEGVWNALWIPTKEQKEEGVLYGYSVMCRNKESAINTANLRSKMANCQIIKYKRSEFVLETQCVTKAKLLQDIESKSFIESYTRFGYKTGGRIEKARSNFVRAFAETQDKWEHYTGYNMFEKMRDVSSYRYLLFGSEHTNQEHDFTWTPSFDSFVKYLITRGYGSGQERVFEIINKPFFKKRIDKIQSEIDELFKTATNKNLVTYPWDSAIRLVKNISYIVNIWPDCPIDYFQTYVEFLGKLDKFSWHNLSDASIHWLRENMPVATFFNFIKKRTDELIAENKFANSTVTFDLMCDTISMLNSVLRSQGNNSVEIQVLKRWRLVEFHDQLQAISWTQTTTNEVMPQDLFPNPVSVFGNDEFNATYKWTFFQPKDLHQLASWGKAVRNCVGAASSYAYGVKKKKHFIVLGMVDNVPKFTIQLKVENGSMTVQQIVNVCNASLTSEEKDEYTKMFSAALEKRDQELVK
jgi:hypothetical protein